MALLGSLPRGDFYGWREEVSKGGRGYRARRFRSLINTAMTSRILQFMIRGAIVGILIRSFSFVFFGVAFVTPPVGVPGVLVVIYRDLPVTSHTRARRRSETAHPTPPRHILSMGPPPDPDFAVPVAVRVRGRSHFQGTLT